MGGGWFDDRLQKIPTWEAEAYLFTWLGIILLITLMIFVFIAYCSKQTKKNKRIRNTATCLLGVLAGFLLYSAFSYESRVGLEKTLLVYVAIPLAISLFIKSGLWLMILPFRNEFLDKESKKAGNLVTVFCSAFLSFAIGSLIVGLRVLG